MNIKIQHLSKDKKYWNFERRRAFEGRGKAKDMCQITPLHETVM